jgi:hypothetical protein
VTSSKGFIVPPLSGWDSLDGQKHSMVIGTGGRASPNPGGGSGAFKKVGF